MNTKAFQIVIAAIIKELREQDINISKENLLSNLETVEVSGARSGDLTNAKSLLEAIESV